MKDNTLTITINKPISEVFSFCITPPKTKLWVPHFVDEKTNEWPVRVGTVYTEYKDNNTSFKIIVSDYKENEHIEWKAKDDRYQVRYTFTPINENTTQLTYYEWMDSGELEDPFPQSTLDQLKKVLES